MSDLDLIQLPTVPLSKPEDVQAEEQWRRTGVVSWAYIQDFMRQEFSSLRTSEEVVLERMKPLLTSHGEPHVGESGDPPTSNRSV
jgi:hypothetical protein